MENVLQVDRPHLQVPTLEDRQINNYKHQGDHQIFGRQARGSSYSAPLFPEKVDSYEKPKETQPRHSYVLPPPRTPVASIPQSNPFSKSQQTVTNHETDPGNDNTSVSTPKSTIKDSNSNVTSIIHLPAPSHSRSGFDSHPS
ncbi:hypothetical protein L2E82_33200 [Cichorium intybus]|uniref:Uncharacterized protein n=1 Tax=Cichorium intybus TaxID=13427 RepID=A0ACB9BJI0_CICIN|nr:hypothetical protein L2E82_33200 [Cichorium intybus]